MKKTGWLEILLLAVLTFLLLLDYFPGILLAAVLPKSVLIGLLICIYIFGLVCKRKTEENHKKIFLWQIYMHVHLLILICLFTILGGKSVSGVSLGNVFLWIVLAVSVYEMVSQWKRSNRELL